MIRRTVHSVGRVANDLSFRFIRVYDTKESLENTGVAGRVR